MNRMISNPPDLAQRVEKLEKANRRLKLAGVLALALGGCLLLLGVVSPKRTVEAEAFIFRDANGKVRALLAMAAKRPTFVLSDANGKMRAALAITADGPSLGLFDANGNPQVILTTRVESPAILIYSGSEVPRVVLGALEGEPEAGTGLILRDPTEKAVVLLTVSEGGPELDLIDANGKVVFSAPR